MTHPQACLLLILAALLWGLGNVPQKTVLHHLDPFSAVGLRCLLGGLLILPLAWRERASVPGPPTPWPELWHLSGLFALAMLLDQGALLDTTVTNAGFLVETCVVMTPLAAWLLLGERPGPTVLGAAGLTLLGVLSLSGGLSWEVNRGDATALLSAAVFAVWLVRLGQHVRRWDRPFQVGAVQFLVTAALTLPVGLIWGDLTWSHVATAGPDLLFLGVVATGLAFPLQIVAHRVASASAAAIITSSEGLVGAVAAIWLLGEPITLHGAIGAALILAAIALVVRPERGAGTQMGTVAIPSGGPPIRSRGD